MKRFPLIYWLPVLLYYGFITYLSSQSPNVPNQLSSINNLDKVFHFIEYMFFGLVLARDLFWQKVYLAEKKKWLPSFLFFMLILITLDEMHQSLTPHRDMNIFDGVADICGAFLGALLFVFVFRGRTYSVATPEAFQSLRARDRRNFSPVAAAILFFVVFTLNVLNMKQGIDETLPILGNMLHFFEWAAIGFMSYRAFFLFRGDKELNILSWIGLALLGWSLASLYTGFENFVEVHEFTWAYSIAIFSYFAAGALVAFAKIAFVRLQSRVETEPTYKRESLQRLYYFYAPFLMGLLIFIFSTLSPEIMTAGPARLQPVESTIAFFLFFAFGIMVFRAVAWESWWHEPKTHRLLLGVACVLLVISVLASAYLTKVSGRTIYPLQGLLNVLAVTIAFVVYFTGFRLARKSMKGRKIH